eukprot:8993183-Heterocapsa_arctica.AAC.1
MPTIVLFAPIDSYVISVLISGRVNSPPSYGRKTVGIILRLQGISSTRDSPNICPGTSAGQSSMKASVSSPIISLSYLPST